MKKWLYPLTLALSLAPCLTSPAQGRPQPRPVLQALDTDHDGALSAAESAAAPQTLLTLDLNRDGQLTPDEILPRREDAGAKPDELVRQLMLFDKNGDGVLTQEELPARMAGMFQRADTNRDGKLTPDEIRAIAAIQGAPNGTPVQPGQASGVMRLDPVLNALDTNHDGTLSAAEIAAASQTLRTLLSVQPDSSHTGALSADDLKVHQMTAQQRAEHLLENWDTNKDGKLSKEEAPERMIPDFERIDTNRDGLLDQPELTVWFQPQSTAPRAPAVKEKQ